MEQGKSSRKADAKEVKTHPSDKQQENPQQTNLQDEMQQKDTSQQESEVREMRCCKLTAQDVEERTGLWQLCFHDDPSYIKLFFQHFNMPNFCRGTFMDGKLVSTLYNIENYQFPYAGELFSTSYFYALATLPEYRNRGTMSRLITETLNELYTEGESLAILIPAEPWLFDYYARFGFSPVFRRSLQTLCTNSPNRAFQPQQTTSRGQETTPLREVTPKAANRRKEENPVYTEEISREEAMELLLCEIKRRKAYLQHSLTDLPMVMDDLSWGEGRLCGLRSKGSELQAESNEPQARGKESQEGGGELRALALLYPQEKNWLIGEWVGRTEEEEVQLLHLLSQQVTGTLCRYLPATAAQPGRPFGMARLIHVERWLAAYARVRSELSLTLQIHDPQIADNNGCFCIDKGKCLRIEAPLSNVDRTLDISQLADEILSPINPYMSLMLE